METHYFALRDGKIVYVPDVPIIIPSVEIVGNLIKNKSRYKRDQQYKQALQSAIANGKVVENQWEVMRHIFRTNEKAQYLLESTLYPLQCRVEKDIRFLGEAPEDRQTVARVTFDEQPEKETANAILNKFCTRFQADSPIEEGRPLVVTVTEALKAINFALCQQPKAAGQEQEDDEYLERVLFLSLAQRDCTTDEGLDKAVEETFWNLKDKFTITRKP